MCICALNVLRVGNKVISVPACLLTFMHMLGPDESWNKVPNEGYIGQVLLLHPENTAPGIRASY